ncbi:3'(2'),5'-bisphosphate nucleotidase CysQ [Qipengyuania sediminis]|uniref:3'(2'),5'-bisphosphate nucleotidase CysQ n=1 Tax=Qipengyuania sediminis TaxID=1532023 RepID=UPI001059B9A4|nr:3'(2'),5'-bisphosphate nucleotidase CysQ [Qipengyuania sediminis]
MTDAQLAAQLAEEAGRLLLAIRARGQHCGKALGQAGDEAANAMLVSALRDLRPDDGLLSEEERDSAARLGQSRVWIIDPLDGTREFAEGRADWAVHVALAIDGIAAVGAVALPALGQLFVSDRPIVRAPAPPRPRMVVSRTRPPAEAQCVAQALTAKLVPMGSAGAKAMAVVRGDAEIYLHAGGQHQWDNCAPVAVAAAQGLFCSRLDGSPLVYNAAGTLVPDLLICDPALAESVLALLAR